MDRRPILRNGRRPIRIDEGVDRGDGKGTLCRYQRRFRAVDYIMGRSPLEHAGSSVGSCIWAALDKMPESNKTVRPNNKPDKM